MESFNYKCELCDVSRTGTRETIVGEDFSNFELITPRHQSDTVYNLFMSEYFQNAGVTIQAENDRHLHIYVNFGDKITITRQTILELLDTRGLKVKAIRKDPCLIDVIKCLAVAA